MDVSPLGPWLPLLAPELTKPYFLELSDRVDRAYETATVFPPKDDLFLAFRLTPPEQVRAVILGQDPYHQPGQAHGLAFSVRPGTPLPPSARNLFQERQSDLGVRLPVDGDLTGWASQGVLLLNTVLTVECGKANSHSRFGWQTFTDAVIAATNDLPQPICFLLWGAQAQKKRSIGAACPYPRLFIESAHPSPLSAFRGFFGSRPFSRCNCCLEQHGQRPILW